MSNISIFDMMYPDYRIDKPIRLIELFAGVGSQAMALRNIGADFEHYKISEWEVSATASYKAIHMENDNTDYSLEIEIAKLPKILFDYGISKDGKEPMTLEEIERKGEKWQRITYNNLRATNNLGSICNFKGEDLEIVDTDSFTYLLTYSFPCQDLSVAGKMRGMAKGSGTRSGLLWEVERLLNEVENLPQVLLMENVPQVIGKKNIDNFHLWQQFLEDKGYSNFLKILNAKDYGVAQNRERCFMVSLLGEWNYKFPKPIPLTKTMKDYLEDEVDEKYYINSEKAQKLIQQLVDSKQLKNDTECVDGSVNDPKTKEISNCIKARYDAGISNFKSDGGMVVKVKVIGQMDNTIDHTFESANRVYDKEGLSPTINTCGGGGLEPKIIEDYYVSREPRVYDETAPTIRAEREGLKVIEDYIMPGNNFNQCNKVHPENGICRTIIGQGHAGNEPKVIVASRGGSKPKDLTNKRFGKLVAIKNTGEKKNQSYVWECICDCGNKANVNVKDLQSGHTKSCGCLIAENHFKDHGMTGTRIYSIWKDMRQRCNNPNNQAFKHYGERGIKVCSEWDNDFQDFYDWAMVSGYNDELSIDRIDNDGDYEPSNCRWVTQKEQMNNTRSNKYISYNGITKTLTEWSDETEVPTQVISYRIKEGWDLKRALYEPSKLGKNQYSKPIICASRGRNPGNPSDRKQGIELEQRLEPNSEGICNTLTSVQKDNLLLTPNNWKHKAGDGTKTRSRRISEIHPALQANTGASQQTYLAETPYRIRKLTPKECAKLMKFSDEDANKMLEVNSNTQVYKQCGNSIVVSVLEAIFCQMNIKGCPTWEERAKEEYL